jgi:hypothetical protein
LEKQFGNDSCSLVSCLLQYLILIQESVLGLRLDCLLLILVVVASKLKDNDIIQDILEKCKLNGEGFIWNYLTIVPISVD